MSFLKGEWRKLAFINYEVPPAILESYVPAGTQLDFWEGKCYVSLVGFNFLNTRILGLKIPFHVNFEEFNLRFYVKHLDGSTWKRGVVFIKEIVPKWAITFVANTLYKENYATAAMKHVWEVRGQKRHTEYYFKHQEKWQSIKLISENKLSPVVPNSETEFITEHYWGYAKKSNSKTNEYEVTHPSWEQYVVLNFEVNVDCGSIYGKEFAFLSNAKPTSVFLAEGSKITIEGKTEIFG